MFNFDRALVRNISPASSPSAAALQRSARRPAPDDLICVCFEPFDDAAPIRCLRLWRSCGVTAAAATPADADTTDAIIRGMRTGCYVS
jgi:hypothetical protein